LRYAILSDIHGNLEAFQAVLKDLEDEGLQKIIYLGDIVGYGANPRECIDLLREKTQAVVAGNHDWGTAGKTDIHKFNSVAQTVIKWTISQLSPDYKDFLAKLPLIRNEIFFIYTHSAPLNPQEWNYIFSDREALRNLKALTQKEVCFIGHSHVPLIFVLDQFGELVGNTSPTKISMGERSRFLINTGSVGQPRDGDSRAAYGILDSEKRIFCLRRIKYDVAIAQKKILSAGLPPILAERISKGW